jgi:hypothetical protein
VARAAALAEPVAHNWERTGVESVARAAALAEPVAHKRVPTGAEAPAPLAWGLVEWVLVEWGSTAIRVAPLVVSARPGWLTRATEPAELLALADTALAAAMVAMGTVVEIPAADTPAVHR